MPAKSESINLLSDDTNHSPSAKIIAWITSYGRYIMVTTELVVLIAFASRFSLDRKLSDLNEEIYQKQEILEVNKPIEANIRLTQDKLKTIKQLLSNQTALINGLTSLHTSLPAGVYLETLSIQETKLITNIIATSTQGLTGLLTNLSQNKTLTDVEIGTITKAPGKGIRFPVTAGIPGIMDIQAKEQQPQKQEEGTL